MNNHAIKYALTDSRCDMRRSLPSDVGLDLKAVVEDFTSVSPGTQILVPTGVRMAFTVGTYALVLPRSGNSLRGITVPVGLIDTGYRGEIKVVVANHTHKKFSIAPYQRIAQLVIQPDPWYPLVWVGDIEADTARGENGFGSSGV